MTRNFVTSIRATRSRDGGSMGRRLLAFAVGPSLVALLSLVGASAYADSADFVLVGADAVVGVSASSALGEHPPEAALDGRLGTPWVSSSADRDGASITLRFNHVRWFAHVDIASGHGRDNNVFREFGRPAELEVQWGGRVERYPLRDVRRTQRVSFNSLVVTDTLTFTVRGVAGPAGVGVAVSEIALYEPRDVAEADPAFRAHIREAMAMFDDPDRIGEAIEVLGRFGRHATAQLLQRVMDPGADNRQAALEVVLDNDPEAARRVLSRLLRSSSADEVLLALEALRRRSGSEHRLAVIPLLSDPRSVVRRAALVTLSDEPPVDQWRGILEGLARDPAATVRREALTAVAQVAEPWASELLSERVLAANEDEGRLALELLLARPGADLAPTASLVRALRPERAANLVGVLGAHVRPETTRLLADLMLAEAHHVLYRPVNGALDAHGLVGIRALLERLEARGDVPPSTEDFILERADLAAPLAGPLLARVLGAAERDDLVHLLVEVIGRARAAAWRDDVTRVFASADRPRRVRDAALRALGRLGPNAAAEALVRAEVVAPRSAFRATAYLAAIDLDLRELAPVVRAGLEATLPRLWEPLAVEVVARLGGDAELALLFERYRDANHSARVVILDNAARARSHAGLKLLVTAASSPDRTLRRIAERHLADVAPPRLPSDSPTRTAEREVTR